MININELSVIVSFYQNYGCALVVFCLIWLHINQKFHSLHELCGLERRQELFYSPGVYPDITLPDPGY